jgi:hypothetical protein
MTQKGDIKETERNKKKKKRERERWKEGKESFLPCVRSASRRRRTRIVRFSFSVTRA